MRSDSARPRLSILIPNYNNGRASSKDGRVDFLEDLLQSLEATLAGDPTPLEIVIHDDGSTDDSLETARRWTKKIWTSGVRAGEPFCRLTEGEHTGILSISANKMMRESRGEICARLDGDIVCLTKNWARIICDAFDLAPPNLGIIGPKQLGVDRKIHSYGQWILHPRGFHHVAQGAPRHSVARSIEVDHVMGCFYCYRRDVWHDVGGFDETYLRGQTVDFGLMARLKGWRAIAIPNVEFEHRHSLRKARATDADTDAGVDRSLARFTEKWGFNRLAPDLDVIRERYRGTPLLWNPDVFGPAAEMSRSSDRATTIQDTEWGRFAQDASFQNAVQARLSIIGHMKPHIEEFGTILHVGCRAGLVCHLLAQQGQQMIGVDHDAGLISLARRIVESEQYHVRPEFIAQRDPHRLPLNDGSVDHALVIDLIEHHRNPVGLFREIYRVLKPNGCIGIVSPQRPSPFDAPGDGRHLFRSHELDLILRGSRLFQTMNLDHVIPGRELIFMIARRKEEENHRGTESQRRMKCVS